MGIHLHHKNILVTREEQQAKEFADLIQQFNGHPYIVPLLKINSVVDKNLPKIVENMQQYEWIFFTSANGVRCFFDIWQQKFGGRKLEDQKFAVVGTKTSEVLRTYGYEATFVPSIYNAETMALEFLKAYNPERSVLLVRGKLARQTLPETFTKVGVHYECLVVYETSVNDGIKESLNDCLHYSHIDYITFTSPSTVDAFFSLIEHDKQIEGKEIVCIGTTTARRAMERGLNVLVPEHFTVEGMIRTISDHIAKKGLI